MVEQGNPLLEEVREKRRIDVARKADEEKARVALRDFKVKLGSLITLKVPAPEVVEVNSLPVDWDGAEGRKTFKTKLTATIEQADGSPIVVTVSSTKYPDVKNPEGSSNKLDYRIDVAELDRILFTNGEEAILQSRAWEHEPFTMHTPIGVRLPSWPAWQRMAVFSDLVSYEMLIEDLILSAKLGNTDVAFEGSTPPIQHYDIGKHFIFKKMPPQSGSGLK